MSEQGLGVNGQEPEHAGAVARLARQMGPDCVDVVDVDELVAAIEATGVNDRVARQRYGQTSVFSLGEAVLARLHADRAHQMARLAAQARRPARPEPYAGQALLRCALYLTPVLLAAAAAGPLGTVPWPAPAAALVLGWSGAQALAYLGHFVGAHRGPGPATRLLLAGFAALAGAWSGVLALAPARVVDWQRPTAYAITLAELAYFAAVAAALVTRSERAVLLWTLPSWAVAAVAVTGHWPAEAPISSGWALTAGIALTVVRAFRHLGSGATGKGASLCAPDLARALAYLLIGGGQALAFVLVWRAAPGGSALPPAALPLLAAVPLLEVFVGWHTARVSVGLDAYDDHRAYRRHLRGVATSTVAALLPPLITGMVLAAVSMRLPLRLGDHPDPPAMLLAMAAGVLLAGVFAIVLLLATRRRLATAALLAAAPVALAIGLTLWPPAAAPGTTLWAAAPWERQPPVASQPVGPLDAVGPLASGVNEPQAPWCSIACLPGDALLPNTVIALTMVYALGLALATYALFDPRSYR